ncbi:MAG: NAD+ synthase [Chlorobiales bacterium]|nr:NAD+ synthase [Chlorobiales bacterium]
MNTQSLHLNYVLTEEILLAFIRNEISKFGFETAVLGLSGGIDSAVVCELAAKALGPDNVLAVLMPYRTSSSESVEHARMMVERTGVLCEEVEISDVVDTFFEKEPDAEKLRMGNVMARIRMLYLYDASARDGRLVIGTSNKTELLLGYGTLFGDMASAINPIGDLYKTQVWGLARYLQLPEEIVSKTPSADFWEGQSDEADLGFGYGEADLLLYLMLEKRMSRAAIIQKGVDESFYDKVRKMVVKNQYKRMMPVIAKISSRTPGIDFRYARDWQEVK